MTYSTSTRTSYANLFREAESQLSTKLAPKLAQVMLKHVSVVPVIKGDR